MLADEHVADQRNDTQKWQKVAEQCGQMMLTKVAPCHKGNAEDGDADGKETVNVRGFMVDQVAAKKGNQGLEGGNDHGTGDRGELQWFEPEREVGRQKNSG